MRALFWDIDGVLQPLGRQNRFKHLEEIPGLCREPNRILDNGFDCVAYIEEYGSNVYDVAAAYAGFYRCKNRPVKRLARRWHGTYAGNAGHPSFGHLSGGRHLFCVAGASLRSEELQAWREKYAYPYFPRAIG